MLSSRGCPDICENVMLYAFVLKITVKDYALNVVRVKIMRQIYYVMS